MGRCKFELRGGQLPDSFASPQAGASLARGPGSAPHHSRAAVRPGRQRDFTSRLRQMPDRASPLRSASPRRRAVTVETLLPSPRNPAETDRRDADHIDLGLPHPARPRRQKASRRSARGNRATGRIYVDKVMDFQAGIDTIVLDDKVFKKLSPGPLSVEEFAVGKKAKEGSDHVIRNQKKGPLLQDQDGKGGKDALLFRQARQGPRPRRRRLPGDLTRNRDRSPIAPGPVARPPALGSEPAAFAHRRRAVSALPAPLKQ